jgi:hypothetical protein
MTRPPSSPWFMPTAMRSWERFWFTPMDPTVLGLIRIGTGLITLYVLCVYSFQLQETMGANAWLDLKIRSEVVHNRQMTPAPLFGDSSVGFAEAKTPAEKEYVEAYKQKFFALPPPPFPQGQDELQYIDAYRARYGFDLRAYGLRPPQNDKEKEYLERYTSQWKAPPPKYPASEEEDRAVEEYIETHGADPRRTYARGIPIFSIWFHVTDPTAMAALHATGILVSLLFTLGLATRLTSALTWFAVLCYIHRNPNIQFGMDTMMVILLTYTMLGPSGSALSLDRRIARWWSQAKPDVVRWWYRLWHKPEPSAADIAPAPYAEQPLPSISANLAIRMLQVHVCFIYMAAGLSKLLGPSWWDGTAVWGTLANPASAISCLAARLWRARAPRLPEARS